MATWWPIAVSAAFCALVVWAQYVTSRNTVRLLKREIARIGAEKSALQQLISGRSLEHRSGDDEEDI
jgi:hypothetical protein